MSMIFKEQLKLRLKLESFNHKFLIQSYNLIKHSISLCDSKLSGIIPLPTKKRIYCVLRSPHVNKNSREHFEIRIHKRIFDIYYEPNVNIIEFLSKVSLPASVSCKITLIK
jgi:small subunit ribosomal protein S10